MLKNNAFSGVSALVLGLALLDPARVAAQESRAPGTAISSETDISEIVVTASKGESQTVLRTPLAINVVTGQTIAEKGYTSLTEVLAATPGLVAVETIPGSSDLNIRGIAAIVGDPTVGVYIDDLPFIVPPTTIQPNLNPYDLDRVEVLRGPQGTLYGAGAMGGVIRVLNAKPQTDRVQMSVNLGSSTVDKGGAGYKAQGMINIPIVRDKLAVRVSGGYVKTPGYIDLPLVGETNFNTGSNSDIRAKAIYTPTNNTEFGFSFFHANIKSHASYSDSSYDFNAKNEIFDGPALFTTGSLVDVGDRPLKGSELTNFLKYDFYTTYAKVDLDKVHLYGTASYGKITMDTGGYEQAAVALNVLYPYKTRSAEVRATYAGSDRFGTTLGAFYLKSTGEGQIGSRLFTNLPGLEEIDSVSGSNRISSDQYALFGEAYYYLIPDTLKMTAGLRYFHDNRSVVEKEPGAIALLNSLGIPLVQKATFSPTTKRFNISYTPTPNLNLYVNYAEGFRSGTLNGGPGLLAVLQDGGVVATQPDDLKSYEAGAKMRTLDGRLTFELTGYYWKWKDIQVSLNSILHPPYGIGPATYFANASTGDSFGLDFATTFTGIKNLTLSVSGNVNNNRYTENQPTAGLQKGDQIGLASRYNLLATASWRKEVARDLNAVATLSYSLMGPVWTYGAFTPPTRSDPVRTLGLRLGVERGRALVSIYGDNLLNANHVSFAFGDAIYLLGAAPVYQRPRTIGAEITLKY